ncbi:MAG TPA: molybdopterin cofactor-binding domain-containing protein [Bryobacteraceae bacterium]|nr:molybdopterin cofactor-binding domain-containing protein [Bryobacteraceae bacterium]
MLDRERYELFTGPAYRFELERGDRFELQRRDLFKLLGGGLLFVLFFDGEAMAQESGRTQGFRADARPAELAAWLHIDEDGTVTIYTGKVEVGQNARTALTQAVAEQLRADLSSIKLVMGDTDLTPYDMGTFGSRTTPTMAPQLKKVGVAARETLIDLAAEKWKVDRKSISVAGGKLKNSTTGDTVGFGDLTRGQKLMKTVDGAAVTPADKWTIAGTSVTKVNARDMVTGAHRYSTDIVRPRMLFGRILRPYAFNAKLVSLDTKAVASTPGLVIVHDGNFVGVVAPDELTLSSAIAGLIPIWKADHQPSNKDLFAYLKTHPAQSRGGGGGPSPEQGSVDQGLQSSDHKLDATYTVAYIAHTPLEPRAAVAEWNSGKLTVWTGTQRPFGVKSELSEAFKVPEDHVRVIVPDTGSGYGGKHTGEVAIEAARLALAAGQPVKVIWTREDEFTWAYFRPAGVIDIRSGATKDGLITAWEFHNYNSGPSGIDTPYEIPNRKIEFHPTETPLRQGSYRGLAATANHFARESHMDEIAAALGMDPLEFRLKNLKDERLRAVLQAAAEKFGWGKAKSEPTRGFGLACGVEKGSYVAACAEISISQPDRKVKIEKVVTAFECGAIVNPEHLKNQVEGSVIQGIGGALFEAIEFENGRILNPRVGQYRLPRFSDVPAIETILLDRKDLPSAGAGETPIVGLAPAVGNAIYQATGVRIRTLPMVPHGVPHEA